MSGNALVFDANMDQLYAFAEDGGTRLVHSENADGNTFFHCLPASRCCLSSNRETSEATISKVAVFIQENIDFLENSHQHHQVLFTLKREFGEAFTPISSLALSAITTRPAEHPFGIGYDERQDVKIVVDSPNGPLKRWAHSQALIRQSDYLRRKIREAKPQKDGSKLVRFEGLPPQLLDTALALITDLSFPMPKDVPTLCSMYHFADQLEIITGKKGLRDGCLHQVFKQLNPASFLEAASSVSNWTTDLGSTLIDCAARDFAQLCQQSNLHLMTIEAMLQILSRPALRMSEAKLIPLVLKWAKAYAKHHKVQVAEVLQTRVIDDHRVVDFVRFELLSLAQFVSLTKGTGLCTENEFHTWCNWLSQTRPPEAMPQRCARVPLLIKSSSNGRQVHIYWKMPVGQHLLRAPRARYGIETISATPAFKLGGDEWRLEFCHSSTGPYFLGLHRQFTYSVDPIRVHTQFIADHHSTEIALRTFSPAYQVEDFRGMGWEWIDRMDPRTNEIPIEIILNVLNA